MSEHICAGRDKDVVTWRAYGIGFGDTYFTEPTEVEVPRDVDVMAFRFFKIPRAGASETHTLTMDLTDTDEALLARMKQETRYKIRRAEERDGLTFTILGPRQLRETNSAVTEFLDYFNVFARHKGLATINESHLMTQARSGILWLTSARKDDRVLVWHAYVTGRARARLRNSASHFRTEDSATSNLIGRANRWLHWRGMRAFRREGMEVYDFGGWYAGQTDNERLRINRFKEAFGGRHIKEYSCTIPVTLRGRAFTAARSIYGWTREVPSMARSTRQRIAALVPR